MSTKLTGLSLPFGMRAVINEQAEKHNTSCVFIIYSIIYKAYQPLMGEALKNGAVIKRERGRPVAKRPSFEKLIERKMLEKGLTFNDTNCKIEVLSLAHETATEWVLWDAENQAIPFIEFGNVEIPKLIQQLRHDRGAKSTPAGNTWMMQIDSDLLIQFKKLLSNFGAYRRLSFSNFLGACMVRAVPGVYEVAKSNYRTLALTPNDLTAALGWEVEESKDPGTRRQRKTIPKRVKKS